MGEKSEKWPSDRVKQFCRRKEGREGVTGRLIMLRPGSEPKMGLSGPNTCRTKAGVFCFVDKVLNF